jgi:hypothetical protein
MSFFIEFDPTEGMQELDDSDFAAKIENQFTPGHLVQSSYSKLASCLAIFSIVFSAVLSLMHQHHRIDGEACCGVPHQHSQSQIPGLEDIPASDCDCSTQLANDADSLPANEQEDSERFSSTRSAEMSSRSRLPAESHLAPSSSSSSFLCWMFQFGI